MMKRIARLKNESEKVRTLEVYFVTNPKIIILDETTSNLDTENEVLIQKSLSELVKNHPTFVIAHRLSTINKADQKLVIVSGRIAEQGTFEELITKEGRCYDFYKYQAKI